MNPFQSLRDYEIFIYTLQQNFPALLSSTLRVIQSGKRQADVVGELVFGGDVRLVVDEYLIWEQGPMRIDGYSYEVWRGSEKLYWYDSQPHPNDPSLASTHPHHKHTPPNIKHHRLPAPGLSFERPNLPFLIEEIEGKATG